MNKKCNGCLSLVVTGNGNIECRFTIFGTSDIPKCVCKKCLVKVTCKYMCEDFRTCGLNYNNSIGNKLFLSTMKAGRLE